MGRDTLRLLEDEVIRARTALKCGKTICSLENYIDLVCVLIKHQKEINELKEKVYKLENSS